jgi:hypothetical protein
MRTVLPNHAVAKEKSFLDWLRKHDVEPNDCYRVDMHKSHMVVHCYKRNQRGYKYTVVENGEANIAKLPPKRIEYLSRYWVGESNGNGH